MKRSHKLPKGVWFARKRLSDGQVVRYGYLGRGPGAVALGREGAPEFYERLAEALDRAPQEGKVAHLVYQYLASRDFARLRPRTQSDYRRHLDEIRETFGGLSVAAMASPKISARIHRWQEHAAAQSPRQADYAVAVLRAMLAWSVRRGLIDHNRAAGVRTVYAADRRAQVWSHEQEAQLLAQAPAPIARAVILAVETGLSQEDLLVLPWSAVGRQVLTARRLKNGTPVAVPISPRLREMLDAAPRGSSLTVLTKADGLPFDPKGNGLRSMFRAARDAAGIKGLTFHDLRGTFITRRRSLGWTAEEVALCSGHKVEGERGAQAAYVDRAAVAAANAERLWQRTYGSNAEQKLQTGVQTAPVAGGLTS